MFEWGLEAMNEDYGSGSKKKDDASKHTIQSISQFLSLDFNSKRKTTKFIGRVCASAI